MYIFFERSGVSCSVVSDSLQPHGQRSLAGYSPWDLIELYTTQQLNHHHRSSITVNLNLCILRVSPLAQMIKNMSAMQETQIQSLGQEGPLEKGMATHSSILAWRILGTEEPEGLRSMGSQRVGHD